jgi:hypothetical protein
LKFVKQFIVAEQVAETIAQRQMEAVESGIITSSCIKMFPPNDENQNPAKLMQHAKLVAAQLGVMVNLVTQNESLACSLMSQFMENNQGLVDFVFNLCWCNFEDNDGDEIETTSMGEASLKLLLIMIFNACKRQTDKVFVIEFLKDGEPGRIDGAHLIYRVHRYLYFCRDQDEDVSELVSEINEWYTLIIEMLLGKDSNHASFVKVYNAFVSKKEKTAEIIAHQASGGMILIKKKQKVGDNEIEVLIPTED